jgi:hypothetical protein
MQSMSGGGALIRWSEAMALQRQRCLALPPDWRLVHAGEDGEAWTQNMGNGLRVIWSLALERDTRLWLHVSVSRHDRLPAYGDMVKAHRLIVGEDRYSYEVHAPQPRHVNIHAHTLHLWAIADGGPDPLPDFTRGGRTI